MSTDAPPGQRYIPKFVIYAEFGIPNIDLDKYRLVVEGLVRNRLELNYHDLVKLIDTEYRSDFHCVTGWSVRDVHWRGIKLSKILDMAGVDENAKYLYLVSLDNYTTIIDINDAKDPRAIIALEINGRPLSIEQGFPARVFVPHLYGWKSAKWLSRIIVLDKYIDGYWEARGYHERGRVWEEERFKGHLERKHTSRRPISSQ
jgi:DMSO/TMAO reductase YedYZ molybdopterin-dependent catalytic subunit